MSSEEWRAIPAYPLLEASTLGRIRLASTKKIKKLSSDGRGYLVTGVGNRKVRRIHRLVGEAFLGPCPAGHQVNHLNGVKDDNTVLNLEYVTPAENTAHAIRTGLMNQFGENNSRAKLSLSDVQEIHRLRSAGWTLIRIADRYDMSFSTIAEITQGKIWRGSKTGRGPGQNLYNPAAAVRLP